MPLYEYYCPACGHTKNYFVGVSLREDQKEQLKKQKDEIQEEYFWDCPECNESIMYPKSVNTGGSFQLKGSGWFKTGGY